MMDLQRLIRNWHIKAGGEDYFSKFTFEYLAFIAFVKNNKYPEANDDRSTIQQLKRDSNPRNGYLQLVQTNRELRRNWEQIKNEFDREPFHDAARVNSGRDEYPWWNCSHERRDSKSCEERIKRNGVIHSLDDWENMIEFWYCVRNNLFHGAKDPEHRRDQFAVEYAYKTLRELVELFLKDTENV